MPEKLRALEDDKKFIKEGVARRKEWFKEHPTPATTPYSVKE